MRIKGKSAYTETFKEDSLGFFLLLRLWKTILEQFECKEKFVGMARAWFL